MAIAKIPHPKLSKTDVLCLELQCFIYSSIVNVSLNLTYVLIVLPSGITLISIFINLSSVLFKHSFVLMSIRLKSLFKSTLLHKYVYILDINESDNYIVSLLKTFSNLDML